MTKERVLLHEPMTFGPGFPPVAGCGGCSLHHELVDLAVEMGERRTALWIGYEHGRHLVEVHGAVPWAPENAGGF